MALSWHSVTTVSWHSYDIVSRLGVTKLCHDTELRHCVMTQSYDTGHRVTTLCQGAALHCIMTQSYDIVSRRRVTKLCHDTELRHCVKAQSYTVS